MIDSCSKKWDLDQLNSGSLFHKKKTLTINTISFSIYFAFLQAGEFHDGRENREQIKSLTSNASSFSVVRDVRWMLFGWYVLAGCFGLLSYKTELFSERTDLKCFFFTRCFFTQRTERNLFET